VTNCLKECDSQKYPNCIGISVFNDMANDLTKKGKCWLKDNYNEVNRNNSAVTSYQFINKKPNIFSKVETLNNTDISPGNDYATLVDITVENCLKECDSQKYPNCKGISVLNDMANDLTKKGTVG
jgi:cellulose synthase/poly-beta-1,6-N-acetylglucosamine synthase-like glycosyltransferase